MEIYTEVITLKITKNQKETLNKLRKYKVPVSRFIRDAIKEKLEREHKQITKQKDYCPFSNGSIEL